MSAVKYDRLYAGSDASHIADDPAIIAPKIASTFADILVG